MDRKKTLKYMLLLVTTGFFCVLLAAVLYLFHPDYELTDKKVILYDSAESGVMSTFQHSAGVASPEFSSDSGLYEKGFFLTLSAPENCKIYYTLDSSVPTDQSSLYSEAIYVADRSADENTIHALAGAMETQPVDKASVIRAIVYDPAGNHSEIVTKEYFFAHQTAERNGKKPDATEPAEQLPTVSLVSDPVNLFDETRGIYTNYLMEKWEREALFTYYDADGNYVFEQNLGVRLRGTSTRDGVQKDFTLFARSEYDGNDTIAYPLFSTPTDSLILRHRDIPQQEGFLSSLVSDRDLTTQEYQTVNLYFNGEFWGLYSLLTRVDEYYLSNKYGMDENNIAFIKINHFPEGNGEAMQYYQQLMSFLSSTDLSIDANYQKACNMIDIQSLIDWYVTNSYWNNVDANVFNINSMMWRSIEARNDGYENGKWRFGIYDLDHATSTSSFFLIESIKSKNIEYAYQFDYFIEYFPFGAVGPIEDPTINAFMANADFRKQFYNTFLEIAANNFDPDRVQRLLETLPYQEGNDTLYTFFLNRPKYIFGFLDDYMLHYAENYQKAMEAAREEENSRDDIPFNSNTTLVMLPIFGVLAAVLVVAYVRQNGGFRRGKGGGK